MLTKGYVAEDFLNYKKPSMFIAFPICTFKCEKECGKHGICQNSKIALQKNIETRADYLVEAYLKNDISKAIVFGGLEPFDSFPDVVELIEAFRLHTDDDIVIYTGYNEDEVAEQIDVLKKYANIIVKFGRFVPDSKGRYDETLGIFLASDNQYARWL